MAGNVSRGLIIASKTKGWDPTEIPGYGSILPNFDKDAGNLMDATPLGTMPVGRPDNWPDGYDVSGSALRFDAEVPFHTPDVSRETKSRRTTDADVEREY